MRPVAVAERLLGVLSATFTIEGLPNESTCVSREDETDPSLDEENSRREMGREDDTEGTPNSQGCL